MRFAPVQSRFGNRRAVLTQRRGWHHFPFLIPAWFLAFVVAALAITCLLADIGQGDSPDFPLDTRYDYEVGVGWADSGTFRLDTRFSGSTGAGLSGVFTLDTRATTEAMASLSGQVTDATGTPLAGATVLAFQGAAATTGARTDASGQYALPVLEAGTWEIWVSLPGYRTWVQSGVTLVPGQAGTLSVALAPLPALPNVTATDQTVEKTQEAQIVPTTDKQLEVFSGTAFVPGENVDRALPTVIFTHGWNSDPTAWAQAMAAQMIAANIKANLLAWDWRTQADTLEPIEAMSSTRRQGEALGKALAATLGDSYTGTLHFIGHSLGTLVNATAANYLHGLRDSGVAQFPADHTQMTLLDDAGAVNAAGIAVTFGYNVSGLNGSIASQVVQAGYVSPIPNDFAWIDNYISLVGGYHAEAVNVLLPKSAVMADPKDPITYHTERHAYACAWYRQTVLLPMQVLLGYRYALERTGWPGQFPTPSPYQPGSLLSQVLEDDNELHLFQVTREEELDAALGFADKWEILATGASTANLVLLRPSKWAVNKALDIGATAFKRIGNALVSSADAVFHFGEAASPTVPLAVPDFSTVSAGAFLPLSPRIDLTTAGSTPPRRLTGPGLSDEPTATNTPPAVWMTLALPAEVRGLSFDFTLTGGVGSDDYLAFGIDGTNRFALETRFMEPNRTVSSGWIDVSEYAGKSVEFFFGVLGGTSTNVVVAVDGLRFYQAAAPRLELLRSGADIVLRWPADNGGFVLETATTLPPQADWSPLDATLSPDEGFYSVTNAVTDGARFFRLRQSN